MPSVRITQLPELLSGDISGDVILPGVNTNDALKPNRKIKVSSFFKATPKGTIQQPGVAFDSDRGVGLYSSASQKLGLVIGSQSVGTGGSIISNYASSLELSRVSAGVNSITMQLSAQDSNSSNSVNIEIIPKGGGFFTVGGQGAIFTDNNTQFSSTNGRKARFNCDTLNSGGNATKVFNFPGSVTTTDTLLTENATQTFTNKTGLFVGDSDSASTPSSISAGLRVVNSQNNRIGQFVVGHWIYTGTITYRLPQASDATQSTDIVDTLTAQDLRSKNLIQPTFSGTDTSKKISFSTNNITTSRTYTFADANLTVLGEENTANVTNKVYGNPLFAHVANNSITTQRVQFDLSNISSAATRIVKFPDSDNIALGDVENTVLVSGASQEVFQKTLVNPKFKTGYDTWVASESVNINEERRYTNPANQVTNVYVAQNSGATGQTGPIHTTGIASDGGVDWLFVRALNNYTTEVKADTLTQNRFVQLPDRDGTIITEDANGALVTNLTAVGKVSGDQFAGRLRLKQYFLAFS
ncbi:hypothetical protein SWPG_00155 [Synechococcus phage S-CBM2]|nr:hypothetical protein SWPG_00155 [Synechococcus phage S-CBM2]